MRRRQLLGRKERLLLNLDFDHVETERCHDVAIGRITRRSNRNRIAGIEHGEEREIECSGRAGGYSNPLNRHLNIIVVAIVA